MEPGTFGSGTSNFAPEPGSWALEPGTLKHSFLLAPPMIYVRAVRRIRGPSRCGPVDLVRSAVSDRSGADVELGMSNLVISSGRASEVR